MTRPIRVLELRSVWGTGGGPDKTTLLGAAQADGRRLASTVCYIRDARDGTFRIDAHAARLGVDYVEILERQSFDPRIWPMLRRVVRERRIDIVHAHEHKTDLLALLLAWREHVIPLATAHGWSGRSLKERAYYWFDRRLLAYYPAIIAVSDAIRRTLIRYGADPERVHHIRNGIDPAVFRRDPETRTRLRATLGIACDEVVIGSIGRLDEIKRFDVLLEAAARLRVRALVVIAGDGPCRGRLTALAAARGLTNRVRFLGHLDNPRDVHQVFDVYVQSSDSEGIPNAVLEAMAVGTPVVATAVGGTGELITHGVHGLLVRPGDASALSDAIERALSDVDATALRGVLARRRVEEEFSFEQRMRAVQAVYEELIAAYPSGYLAAGRALRWA